MKVNSFKATFMSGSVIVLLLSIFFRFGEEASERFEYCAEIFDEVRLEENSGENK